MPAGPLRRALASFAAMWAGESAFMVALAVLAFSDGGAAGVGVVTAVRMAAAALLTPFLATVADRLRRERVLVGIGVLRTLAIGGAAVVTATAGPPVATYGLAAVATVALGLYRPAHSALLPTLARSPADLTSANATRGLLDSLATLGGPVLAAGLLAASGPAAVFAVCAVLCLGSALAVVALRYDAPPRPAVVRRSPVREVLEGFRTIAGDRGLTLITGLGVVQTFVRGCLTVLAVVMAIDLLHLGDPGVGVLNAAVGAGGVVGSVSAFALVRRGGLATWFGVGVALFGAPLALVGVLPERVAAVVLLGLVGVGNALIDVGGFTMLARLTGEAVLARMFAGFEAVLTLGVGLGGLVAPLLVGGLGARTALVVVGVLAPLAVLACLGALRRLDARMRVRDADIAVLRGVGMLAALPATTIEQLGAGLARVELGPGQVVFLEGDRGEEFYVVETGRAEVVRQGRVVNTVGPGEGFGEIALLGDRPRTATVRAWADGPVRLAVLGQTAFLTAVTGYPASATAGAAVVHEVAARDAARPADREG